MAYSAEIEDAIAHVQDWLSQGRLDPSPHYIGSYRSMRAKCGFSNYDDDGALEVINLARAGDPDAVVVLHHYALDFIYGGQPLPPNLRKHVVDMLEGHMPPRRKRASRYRNRDYFIATGVLIAARHGFPLTRQSKDSRSAWWVVAEALKLLRRALDERTVEDIWDAHPTVRSELKKQTGGR